MKGSTLKIALVSASLLLSANLEATQLKSVAPKSIDRIKTAQWYINNKSANTIANDLRPKELSIDEISSYYITSPQTIFSTGVYKNRFVYCSRPYKSYCNGKFYAIDLKKGEPKKLLFTLPGDQGYLHSFFYKDKFVSNRGGSVSFYSLKDGRKLSTTNYSKRIYGYTDNIDPYVTGNKLYLVDNGYARINLDTMQTEISNGNKSKNYQSLKKNVFSKNKTGPFQSRASRIQEDWVDIFTNKGILTIGYSGKTYRIKIDASRKSGFLKVGNYYAIDQRKKINLINIESLKNRIDTYNEIENKKSSTHKEIKEILSSININKRNISFLKELANIDPTLISKTRVSRGYEEHLYDEALSTGTIHSLNKFIDHFDDNNFKLERLRNFAIRELYNKISKSNDINLLDRFSKKHENHPLAEDAVDKIYSISTQNNGIEEYTKFIENYPNSKKSNEAANEIFKKIKNQRNIAALTWFVESYSRYSISKVAFNLISEISFEKANELNTVEAYNDFIISHPASSQVTQAQEASYELEAEEYSSYFTSNEKLARALLIKSKQLERKMNDQNSHNFKQGYMLVINRMNRLLQDKFQYEDATLRYLESEEFKDFTRTFKRTMKDINRTLTAIKNNTNDLSRVLRSQTEVMDNHFRNAAQDREMAAYYTKQHRDWERYLKPKGL